MTSTEPPTPPVLVVEDDSDIRSTLQQLLEFEGFAVALASNGQEALDYLKTNPKPRIILLDLMMPVMNGWEFLQARSVDAELLTVPVVVISAAKSQVPPGQVLGFLQKPIHIDSLLNLLKNQP